MSRGIEQKGLELWEVPGAGTHSLAQTLTDQTASLLAASCGEVGWRVYPG